MLDPNHEPDDDLAGIHALGHGTRDWGVNKPDAVFADRRLMPEDRDRLRARWDEDVYMNNVKLNVSV